MLKSLIPLILASACCCHSKLGGDYYSIYNDQHTSFAFDFKNDSIVHVQYWSLYTDSVNYTLNYKINRSKLSIDKIEINPITSHEFLPSSEPLRNSIFIYGKDSSQIIDFARISIDGSFDRFEYKGCGRYFILVKEVNRQVKIECLSQEITFSDFPGLDSLLRLNVYFDFYSAKADFVFPTEWIIKGKSIRSLDHKFILRRGN